MPGAGCRPCPDRGGCKSRALTPWLAWPARPWAGLLFLAELFLGFGQLSGGRGGACGGGQGCRRGPCLSQKAGTRLCKAAACAWTAPPVSPRNTRVQPTRVDRSWLLLRPFGNHLVPGRAAVRHGLREPPLLGRPRHRVGAALLRAPGLSRLVSSLKKAGFGRR